MSDIDVRPEEVKQFVNKQGQNLFSNLSDENRRKIKDLDEKVDGININLTKQIDDLEQDVNDKYNELTRDIDDLTDVVEEDFSTLDTKINTSVSTINQRITDVADEINQTIEENVVALQGEDTVLQNQINAQNQTLTNHNTRITANANAIAQEILDRQNGDDILTGEIENIAGELDSKQNILVSGQNIKTINNQSILGEGNIDIQGGGGAGSFGELTGSPYDNTALKNALDSKQNVITNLSTIEFNAQAGKTAKDTIDTYGDIVTHNANEFATTTALTQGLETKQDITDNNLVTLDKTVVGAVNELSAKIREIELYKTPNVLIQGEPTINNGQVTGFSKTNYLILPFEFNVGDRAFELTYAFRTGSDVTTPQNLFGSKFSIASYISGGKLTIRISSNGTSWDILDLITSLNIQPNITYYIKLIFNKLSYEVKSSTDGVEYSQIGRVVDTRPPFAGDIFIGIGNNTNNPFLGMINLHKWELKYNNSVFWEGMDDAGLATRADISLSNLDEQGEARFEAKQDIISDLSTIRSNASTGAELAPQVAVNTQRIEDLTTARIPDVIYHGTPKITGGQVTNFSTVNYLQFPFEDISRSLPFDIYFSFTTSDDVTTQQNIIDSHFGIALAIQNGKGVMALSSNGTSWDIGSAIGTNTLLPNTTYYVKYSWTGTQYNASLSTNDQTYVPDMILNSNKSPYKTTIYIGGCDQQKTGHTPHPFKGIINFTKSRVVVNGITVWEGMADVGIASRANVSLNNLDEVGEARFNEKVSYTDLQNILSDYATKEYIDSLNANGVSY